MTRTTRLTVTVADAKADLALRGIRVNRTCGQYRVTFTTHLVWCALGSPDSMHSTRQRQEELAAYCDTITEAYETGMAMARNFDAHPDCLKPTETA